MSENAESPQNAIERLNASRAQLRSALLSPSGPSDGGLLKQVLHFATDSIEPLIEPMARKNPLLLVTAAALLGGCVVALKPWRWPVASMLAALLPSIGPAVLPGLVQKGVLDVLIALLTRPPEPPAA